MKLTKKEEAEIRDLMDDYWNSYFSGDLDHWATYLVDDYRNIGGTEEEIWDSKKEIIDYTHRVINQMKGVSEIRNKQTQIIPYDPYIMVHELMDIYIKIEDEWTFYQKFRLSSLIQNTTTGWKVLHQHGSYPDSKTTEGEAFAFDTLKSENVKLQKAISERTVELEYKNRELEIEAATERVRVQSMAMQHPDDLEKVNKELLHQLTKLKIEGLSGVSFYFVDEDEIVTVWDLSSPGSMNDPNSYSFKYDSKKHPVLGGFVEILKTTQEDYFILDFPKPSLLQAMEELREINITIYEVIKNAVESGALLHQWNPCARITDGILSIDLMKPPDDDTKTILLKMAGAFNQAYIRFLDLQKAEAQAREAHIEAGLERVRSRSLAMHNTSELQEVIHTVHKELLHLDIAIHGGSFIAINNDIETTLRCWGSGGTANTTQEVHIPLYKKPFCTDLINGIKNGPGFFTEEFTQREKKHFFTFLFKHEPWSKLDTEQKNETLSSPGGYTRSCCVSQHTSIFIINHFGKIFSEDDNEILKRFAKVFEQAYTRFLDLQKAEAQAREGQIEVALEIVRSRSLAMHKSEELNEVVSVLFEKLKELKIPFTAVGIGIYIDGSKDLNAFVCGENEAGLVITNYRLPYFNHKIPEDFNKAREKQLEFFVGHYSKEEKDSFYKYVLEHTAEFRQLPDDIKSMIFESPSYNITMVAVHHAVFNMNDFEGKTLSRDEVDIIKRFAKIFDQAYTRFLDLQKAEAQAREAEIQLALERVRARSLAMHHTSELQEIVKIVAEQLQHMGLNINGGVFITINEELDNDIQLWASLGAADYVQKVFVPFLNRPIFTQLRDAIKKGNNFFDKTYSKEEKDEMLQHLFHYNPWKELSAERKKELLSREGGLTRTAAISQYTSIVITNHNGNRFSEQEIDILKRFGSVFEQSYIRFLDLQKAEAQAREAQIEAALERVRSRTMAMQRSEELVDVATVLFQQVKSLGVPQWNCGFNIWNIGDDEFTYYPGSPDGIISPSPCKIPLTEHPVFMRFDESRKQGDELLIYEKEGEEQADHYRYMLSLPGVGDLLKSMLDSGFELPKFQIDHLANFAYGNLIFITYEHFPEMHDVFKRFSKVFEQTYTRFLDLQKAEAQTREAQIEAALERVRARTMAMQKSSELAEASSLLFKQLKLLGIDNYSSGFTIWDTQNNHLISWMCNADGSVNPPFVMPIDEEKWHARQFQSWKDGEDFIINDFTGEEMQLHFQYLRSFPLLDEAFKKSIAAGHAMPERQVHHVANFSQGNLLFITLEPCAEAHDLMKRFAKVFEQTYTRFLDLQKAEAQSREAQIELGLERVRARAMAMQKSDELSELVDTVFKELTKLDFALAWCIINIIDESSMSNTVWAANPDIDKSPESYHMLFEDYPFHHAMMKGWKERKTKHVYTLEGSEKKIYDDYLFSETEFKRTPEAAQAASRAMEKYVVSFSFSNFGGLQTVGEVPLSDANLDILSRFGKVFDLTYTRFNDLKQAEAQAREAQIEAALERVRSRTMGMQKSEELKEVIQVVYEQFVHLNILIEHTGFVIDYKARDDYNIWIADPLGVPSQVTIPYFDSVYYNRFNKAKENGEDFFATNLSFEEKNKFYQKLFEYLPGLPEEAKKFYFNCPGLVASTVLLENVCLYIENFSGTPYTDEENNTLMRFGKVFQQTYTRFLDLQKAEAQTRKAKIEAALEKVRSRTMGMQQSHELGDVATVLFKELNQLVENLWTCGFVLCDKDRREDEWWLSTGDGFIPAFYLPNTVDPTHANIYDAWKNGETYHTEQLEGEALQQHYDWLMKIPVSKKIFDDMKAAGSPLPGWQKLHCAYFSYGYLVMITQVPCPEEQIFKRFAQVFDQTYTRFLDLQKAEAQSREAQIELGLERVRARAMAMQNSDELNALIGTVFTELTKLDLVLTRCLIIIYDPKTKHARWWMANSEDPENPMNFFVQYHKNKPYLAYLDAWEGRNLKWEYILEGKDKKEWDDFLFAETELSLLPDPVIAGMKAPDRVFLSASFNNFGNLTLATLESLSGEHSDILLRFAKVFDLTYTRFNDLQKAEEQARQARIEVAMEKVRSRAMAMQKPNELVEVAELLRKEMGLLGVEELETGSIY